MNLKSSKYNFFFEHNEKKFVYNTLSTALVELDENEFYFLKKNELDKLDEKYIIPMLNNHILTELNNNEVNEFFYYYDSIRYGKSHDTFCVTLIPSYACNLACTYCMQGQEKSSNKMSKENLTSILIFMENYLQTHKNINELVISLFGGEPMLNKELLYKFCDEANELAIKYKCKTYFTMTSNMTLLDDKMLEYMKKYQIHTQVSIDGTPEQHDKRRIYKNGKGTYELIVKNLCKLNLYGLKELITIRINIDSSNIEDSEEIMSAFKEFSKDVYFGFIDNFKGSNDNFSDCISEKDYPMYVTEKFFNCYKKFGFPIPKLFGKKAPCSMNSESKFFIDSNLDVYKCEMLVKRPDAKVGYISKDGKFIPNSSFYNQMTFSPGRDKKCLDCILLPMCAGGCPAKKYIEEERGDGNLHLPNCIFTENQLLIYLKNFLDNRE